MNAEVFKNNWKSILFGFTISISLITFFLYRLDWKQFYLISSNIKLLWIFAAIFTGLLSGVLRACRWAYLSEGSLDSFTHFWRALQIGYFGNFFLFGNIGELFRIYIINKKCRIPFIQITILTVIDRVADISTMSLFCLLLLFYIYPVGIVDNFWISTALIIASTLVLFLSIFNSDYIFSVINKILIYCKFKTTFFVNLIDQIQLSVRFLKSKTKIFFIVILTLVTFLVDFLTHYFLLQSINMSASYFTAITISIFINMSMIIPSTPGYIGTYQVACVLALSIFGISETNALTYSVISQFLSMVLIALLGSISLMLYGINISSIKNSVTILEKTPNAYSNQLDL